MGLSLNNDFFVYKKQTKHFKFIISLGNILSPRLEQILFVDCSHFSVQTFKEKIFAKLNMSFLTQTIFQSSSFVINFNIQRIAFQKATANKL